MELLLEDATLKKLFKNKTVNFDYKELFEQLGEDLVSKLIGEFSIGKYLEHISYKEGGLITTLHNARNGVFANDSDKKRFNKPYDRKNYEGRREAGNTLAQQRKEAFKNSDTVIDGYTGKPLKNVSSTHADHIISAKEIHNDDECRLYMSDDERNDMAVHKNNMTFTDGKINQSKGAKDGKKWLNEEKKGEGKTNGEYYGIDDERYNEKQDGAKKHVEENKNVKKGEYYAKNLAIEGSKRAGYEVLKEATGIIIFEVSTILVNSIKEVSDKWNNFESFKERMSYAKDVFLKDINDFKNNFSDIFAKIKQKSFNSGLSGFMSVIVETVVNLFSTTAKKFGKLLNTTFNAGISAIKILMNKSISVEDRKKQALKILVNAVASFIAVIVAEAIAKDVVKFFGASLGEAIKGTLELIISSLVGIILILTIVNFDKIIKYISDSIKFGIEGLKITVEELEKNYYVAVNKIDEIYRQTLQGIYDSYSKIKQLQKMLEDMSNLVEVQFQLSISYAEEMNVPEEKIIRNLDDLDKKFMKK